MVVDAIEGHRIWSRSYDEGPNAMLELETRVLLPRLTIAPGIRFFDAGSGTGRWMQWAQRQGALVFGCDACREMVLESSPKAGLSGRSVLADLRRLPIADDAADIALCSFTLGYLESPVAVVAELARVARSVIVSDIHPDAVRRGWTRSFRAEGIRYEMTHNDYTLTDLDAAAEAAGISLAWRVQPAFGDSERWIFQQAGKESAFNEASSGPAIHISAWNRP